MSFQSTRRAFLASLPLAAPLAASSFAAKRPPNIIWIMADDLGYADVSCYGQKHFKTPNIDKLAAEGIRFTDAYAGCTVCAPSRSVLMTGYHTGHTSIRSNPGGVPLLPSDVTVAQLLKKAGYTCGLYGKWGLGDTGTGSTPLDKGFDDYCGYLNQVHAHFYYPRAIYRNDKELPLAGNDGGKRTTYSHDVIAGHALKFIEASKDKPFFCYCPFTTPHWELLVPEDSVAENRGKFPDKAYVDKNRHYADQPEMRAAYAGMVTRMDRDIGRIVSLVSKLGLDGNTIVFFTSDNGAALPILGENFFESTGPLRGHKQNMYEGGIRVPMIARWKSKIKAGQTNSLPWYFADALPTLCEIAGIKTPGGLDGVSVLPTLLGKGKQKAREYLYWELPRYIGKTGEFQREKPMAAVRMGAWKAVRPKPDAPIELYHLPSDIGETKDVSGRYPEVMSRIAKIFDEAHVHPRTQKEPATGWYGKGGGQDFAR